MVLAAATAAVVGAGPTAVLIATAPAPGSDQVVLAEPGGTQGGGGPDGQGGGGGCGGGPGWNGCGGWNPFEGGTFNGCSNGVCAGWDGVRGWGHL